MTTDNIVAWMTAEPSRRHAPETSHDGEVQAAVSQPLPMISREEAMRVTYLLADFGCGARFLLSNFLDSNTYGSTTFVPPWQPNDHNAPTTTTGGIS